MAGPKYILVTTGCGNTIVGGSDMWVNNFLKEVYPKLPKRKNYALLIDSKRPNSFKDSSLPKGLEFHFHGDDPEKTDKWLRESTWIHFLHPHYHSRPHLWKYEDKFGICFVHAYPKDMISVTNHLPELERVQLETTVDENWYDAFLLTCKRRIWIGLNDSGLLSDFPNFTYSIPNYYEFQGPASLTKNILNGEVGFAARAESRKCLHWMNGIQKGYALTSWRQVENLKNISSYTLPTIDIYQWDPGIHQAFFGKAWGIFHGAYFKEPFGYSIFQAVDYGKIPILNKDWAPHIEYKYRASTKNEFDWCIKQIKKDGWEIANSERNRLIEFMKKFDNKKIWADKVISHLLSFY